MVKTDMAINVPGDKAMAFRNLAKRVICHTKRPTVQTEGRRERASGAKGCTVWLEKPQEDNTNGVMLWYQLSHLQSSNETEVHRTLNSRSINRAL